MASDRPLPSSFDENDDFYNESGSAKIWRKVREEPLVPIGCVLTVAAFTNAYLAMRRGDHAQVQKYFRARVAAQGFTILAMVAGGAYYGADRKKRAELAKLKREQEQEEKKQRWIKELEMRDEEDKAVREMLRKRRRNLEEREGEKKVSVLEAVKAAETKKAETAGSGWGAWLGGGKKEEPAAVPADMPKTDEAKPEEKK